MASVISGLPPCPPPVPSLALPASHTSTSSPPPARPQRKIFTAPDLASWPRGSAYGYLTQTILRLTYAVRGKTVEDECVEGERDGVKGTRQLVRFLREAKDGIKDVPLDGGPQRFGNKAFRVWVKRVEDAIPSFHAALLSSLDPVLAASLSPELSFHLLTSLGSPQRLDFGTGHELSFLAYLTLLFRLGVLDERDEQAAVTRAFVAYVEAVREAQRVFKLEPAGSKGVWGLDDHLHLVYLFGASQLIDHPRLRPAALLQPTSLTPPLCSSYLFLSSLAHIRVLKTGPFHEHSPLLHQILSTVPTWQKVTKGLWEMYKAEVLGKLPVVQHMRFGAGLPWTDAHSGEVLPSTGDGRDDEEDPSGEEGDPVAALSGPVITPAPWASSASASAIKPLPPPSHLPSSTSASTTVSHFARRQNPEQLAVWGAAQGDAGHGGGNRER
ncbi:Serine/threonine-protein phosphatase 2A activator 1 [Rhodosporidiobolus nylandii]